MQINPYLNFSGNCEEAFELYHSTLGGDIEISRFSEMPPDDDAPPVDPNWIMHVSLDVGDGHVLMGSDVPEHMGEVVFGNYAHVSVAPDTAQDAKRIFDSLAEGGQVVMPLQSMFWGADFGVLIDRFGVTWMVNYAHPQ